MDQESGKYKTTNKTTLLMYVNAEFYKLCKIRERNYILFDKRVNNNYQLARAVGDQKLDFNLNF
ncbi:MAG: hypothetical protein E6R13_05750 [Spirochaetes bacterium]|nr:MAG: hypothetical protein E6R13_05750 [Spirochaetota bacterium]